MAEIVTARLGSLQRGWHLKRVLGRDFALAYWMITPAVLVLLGLIAFPFIRAIMLAFYSQPIGGEGRFIGLENYRTLLHDPIWWLSLRNTLVYTIFGVGFKTAVGLVFALILHQELRGRNILRALMFVPWSVPIVVDAFVWRWIYNDLNGILNHVLYKLHLINEYVLWTSDPKIVLWAIIAVVVWQGTPFYMMNFLAGLQSIPDELYEAARIDGASDWRIFRTMILPLSSSAMSALGIFAFMQAWAAFIWPLLVVKRQEMYTMELGLGLFQNRFTIEFGLISAGSVVSFIPVVAVFLLFRRNIIRGITLTGLKGA